MVFLYFHFPPIFSAIFCRYQCSAAFPGLDYDQFIGPAADQAVSSGESVSGWWSSGWIFWQQQTFFLRISLLLYLPGFFYLCTQFFWRSPWFLICYCKEIYRMDFFLYIYPIHDKTRDLSPVFNNLIIRTLTFCTRIITALYCCWFTLSFDPLLHWILTHYHFPK